MATIFDRDYSLLKSHKQVNNYVAYEITTNANDILIKYYIEDCSSTWIEDARIFHRFAERFDVVSGGWYGTNGRWKTTKRIYREIKCSNILNLKQIPGTSDNKIIIEKHRFSNKISVEVHSAKVDSIKFSCAEITFTEFYKIFTLDRKLDEFVDSYHLFSDGLTFSGSLRDLD